MFTLLIFLAGEEVHIIEFLETTPGTNTDVRVTHGKFFCRFAIIGLSGNVFTYKFYKV